VNRYSEKNISAKILALPLALLLVAVFNFHCALVPELDTSRTEKIARGPEFTPYHGLKPRIAVIDFENLSGFGGDKLGSAVADQLISQLARSGRYILVERSRIERILQEQALGQSGAVLEETAPEVGKLLGVESLVLGKILEARQETGRHEIENEKKQWAFKLKATIGVVHIAYKMVNTTTGEILLADDVFAREIKPGFGLRTKDFDLENMFEFDQTVLGVAVRKAVNQIAQKIASNVTAIEWAGKVVQCKGDTLVYFTPGRGAGIQLGQLFDIYGTLAFQPEEENSVEKLALSQPKARIQVSGFIGDRVARAKVLQGGRIKRGDLVKKVIRSSEQNMESHQ